MGAANSTARFTAGLVGTSNPRTEEDKALQLCRERKKFVRQALDGRCSLAATHIGYVEALKRVGTALRKFVEPENPVESSMYTSTSATPEPLAFTEKSPSQFSFSSRSLSHQVDATENISPTPSPPTSSRYQANPMRFRGTFSRKIEEKPYEPVSVSITSSSPQNITPHSTGIPESSPFETPGLAENSPWDYFGLFHPIDNHFSQEEKGEYADHDRHLVEEGTPKSEDREEKFCSPGREESQESEDEFDEPSTATLVRSFENVNRVADNVSDSGIPASPSSENLASETKLMKVKNSNSPDLSPLRATVAGATVEKDLKITPAKESDVENKKVPKDFFSSIKDIEYLFNKASESGREVPRMLEANKFHFRPIFPGKESGSMTSSLIKSCFSCGEDPSQVQEEPPQDSVKYLTWHRTASSRSSSSRNPLGMNSVDDFEDLSSNLFDNFCMNSGSHASTLDRLFAWEKKLYDEVKACEMIRRKYDAKRKLLRELESKAQNSDKTRAAVKDLHSRIRIAIHRIDSISRKIEEIRDKELQPQLEELIEGLRRMWEVMSDCHKHQFDIISIARTPGNLKITIQSDSRRQITIYLEHELLSLASSFLKWIGAQKMYVEALNMWLYKCVFLEKKSSGRKTRAQPPSLRDRGPPIYVICGFWLDNFDSLPTKEVADSMKGLAAKIAHFLPRQEKTPGKSMSHPHPETWQDGISDNPGVYTLRDPDSDLPGFDQLCTSLKSFLDQLNKFAESSVKMFTELQKTTEEAKKAAKFMMGSSHHKQNQ